MTMPRTIRFLLKVLLLVTVLFFLIRFGLDYWVNRRLNKLINNQSGQLHELTYSDITIRLTEGSVWLEGLRYVPIKSKVEEVVSQKTNPSVVLELDVERAELIGLSYWSLVKGVIQVDEILIDRPDVSVYILPKPDQKDTLSNFQKTSDLLTGIRLEGFRIENARGSIFNSDLIDTTAYGSMEQFNYEMRDVNYELSEDKNVANWVADIQIQAKNVSIPNAGGYAMNLGELQLDFSENRIQLKEGSMRPTKSLTEFEEENPYRKARFSFKFEDMVLNDVDYSRILYQEWFAKDLQVDGLEFSVFINNQKPFPPNKKFHFIPTLVRAIPKPIALDSIRLNNCSFQYAIPGKDGEKRAQLWFDQINGYLTGLTNQKDGSGNQLLVLDASCSPQGKGTIHTRWELGLNDVKDPFKLSVSGKSLDLPAFNTIVQRTTHVAINEGDMSGLEFSMSGDTKGAHGSISYSLKDVDITVARFKEEKGIKEDKFFSFMANQLVAKTHKEERKYQSTFSLSRPSKTSFFKMFWLGLQEGLKEGFIHNQAHKKPRKRKSKNKA
jgi:hypothetical protein